MNKKFTVIYIGLLFTLGISGFCLNHRLTCNTLGKIVGGCNGPCVSIGSCGISGGMGSCARDPEEGNCGEVSGCGWGCPGTANNQYCVGYIGSCRTRIAVCARMEKLYCKQVVHTSTIICECDGVYGYGANCSRTECY